ncbi:MAG: MMPL family transporter [Aureliella sp.]
MSRHDSLPDRFLALLLARPGSVLCVIALLTVPSIIMLTRAEFATSVVESFVDSREDYLAAMEQERKFVANPDSLVWLGADEGDDLFSNQTLAAITKTAEQLRRLDYVKRVICLTDLDVVGSSAGPMRSVATKAVLNAKLKAGKIPADALGQLSRDRSIASYQTQLKQRGREFTPAQLDRLRRELRNQSPVARRIISDSRQSHVILLELIETEHLPPPKQIEITEEIQQIARQNGVGKQAIYLAGIIPMQGFAFNQINLVLQSYLPLGGLFIAISVLIVFRRLAVIVFTLLLAIISISWGIGLGIAAYGKFSVLMAAVPLMVLVISTADVIHLLSSYTAERANGVQHHLALERMFKQVGGACILTSLTTFVGFASLVFVPSNTIRQFGFSAAAGVASALLLSVVLIPIFLQWLHDRGKPIAGSTIASHSTNSIADGCLRVALSAPGLVVASCVVILATCGWASSKLTLDPDLTKRFAEDHLATRSTQFFINEFGGANQIEFLLSAPRDTLLAPRTLSQMQKFAELCRQDADVSQVVSIADAIAGVLKQLDYENTTGLPESPQHAQATLELLAAQDVEGLASLITEARTETRLLIQVRSTSYMRLLETSQRLGKIAASTFPSSVDVLEKGSAPLVGKAVLEIIRGHLQGFLFCFTTIVFLIIVGTRSVQLGVLSIMPNLTPLLTLGGLIAITYTRVDSDILAVATLGLGLAVDDTIHFLSRFKIEMRQGGHLEGALQRTMRHTGVAIIRTTVILSVGFLPFALSGYWSINMLGTYLVAVLFAALLADLLLLPAILKLCYRHR